MYLRGNTIYCWRPGGHREDESICEFDYENSVFYKPITVKLPDIAVTDIFAPAGAGAQEYVEVYWKAENIGEGEVILPEWWGPPGEASLPSHIRLSTDDQWDYSDIFLAEGTPLPFGEGWTHHGAFYIDNMLEAWGMPRSQVPPGLYYLIVRADTPNDICEANEENNILVLPFEILAPDLVVTDISAPAETHAQEQFEVSWTVKNEGEAEAQGMFREWQQGSQFGSWASGWDDALYLSADTYLDESDLPLTYSYQGSLDADASHTVTQSITIPEEVPEGTYYLLVKTDVWGDIYESTEENNVLVVPITILEKDQEPPVTKHEFSGHNAENIKVTLTATDDDSGVDHTYFSVDGGLSWEEGVEFSVNLYTHDTILYYSVDKDGNDEEWHTINIKRDSISRSSWGWIQESSEEVEEGFIYKNVQKFDYYMHLDYFEISSDKERRIIFLDKFYVSIRPRFPQFISPRNFGATSIKLYRDSPWEFWSKGELLKTIHCSGWMMNPEKVEYYYNEEMCRIDIELDWVEWDKDDERYGVLTNLGAISRRYNLVPPSLWISAPQFKLFGGFNTETIQPSQVASHTVIVDSSVSKATFNLFWEGSDLDLALYMPDGTEINPTIVAGNSNINYVEKDQCEYYTVLSPTPGDWTMKAIAVDVPPEGESYSTVVYLETDLKLCLSADKSVYDLNEGVPLTATLMYDNLPMSGKSVTAKVQRPDGMIDNVILYDDDSHNDITADDGSYSAKYTNTFTEGRYIIIVSASGMINDEQFERTAYTTIFVKVNQPPIADANGPYEGNVGELITFDGTGSYDPDGTSISYEWDLDDEGVFDDATGPTPSETWTAPYSGTIRLRIGDEDGNIDIDSTTVTVEAAKDTTPPTIESVTLDAYTTIPDATIHVTVEATDNVGVTSVTADGVALEEIGSIWEGDITAPSTTGDYTFTIRAKDAAGNFDETTVDYSVVTPQGGFAVGVIPTLSNVNAGEVIDLSVRITSTENFDDKLHVYITSEGIPELYQANFAFSWTEKIIDLPKGDTVILPIAVQVPTGISGYKMFRVKAESIRYRAEGFGAGIVNVI